MDTVLKADIFFVVATGAVVVGTIAFSIAAYYVAKTATEVRELAHAVRTQIDDVGDALYRLERGVLYPFRFTSRFANHLFSSLVDDTK